MERGDKQINKESERISRSQTLLPEIKCNLYCHKSEKDAEKHIKLLGKEGEMDYFYCKSCKKYHVGEKRKSTKKIPVLSGALG